MEDAGVDVTLEGDVLSLSATRKPDCPAGFSAVYEEYIPTNFSRKFSLSGDVDKNNIKAIMKDGILRLVLRKSEHAKPKSIPINSN